MVLLPVVGLTVSVELDSRRQAQAQADVDALLPGLLAFVEDERGLPFREPVQVEVLGDDEFLDVFYEEPDDVEPERADRDPGATLTALGLFQADDDVEQEVVDSLDEGVVGFYDPRDGRLVVRGDRADVFVELVIVHELVHALQDQHFDLERPELEDVEDESLLAFDSLVEGDAVRVELAWYETQTPARRQEVDDVLGGVLQDDDDDDDGDVVESLLGFPYYAGPPLVEVLLAGGGQPALDAAFVTPPTTSEQVLHPDRTGPAAVPVEVAVPESSGRLVDQGVLGELGLALVLGVDPTEPGGPQDGWGGDSYSTRELGGRTCTVLDVQVDSRQDGEDLRPALDEWAADHPDADVADGPDGLLRVNACA